MGSRWRGWVAAAVAGALFAPIATAGTGAASAVTDRRVQIAPEDNSNTTWAFVPETLTIDAGDRVVWHNGTTVDHYIKFDTGYAFAVPAGKDASVDSFDYKPGTYAYHCTIHPYMTATIISRAPTTTTAGSVTTRTTARGATTTTRRAVVPVGGNATGGGGTSASATTTTAADTSTTADLALPVSKSGGGGSVGFIALIAGAVVVLGGGGFGLYRLGARRSAGS